MKTESSQITLNHSKKIFKKGRNPHHKKIKKRRSVFDQKILARKDLLNLGYNLLRYKNYGHEIAEEIALDALYLCAKKYDPNKGTIVQTYYNKCLFWVAGHKKAETNRQRRLGTRVGFEDMSPEETKAPSSSIEIKIEVDQILELLPERESRIMRKVYIEGYTMGEVAKMEGVSRQRIGQITLESRKLLKRKLLKEQVEVNALC